MRKHVHDWVNEQGQSDFPIGQSRDSKLPYYRTAGQTYKFTCRKCGEECELNMHPTSLEHTTAVTYKKKEN